MRFIFRPPNETDYSFYSECFQNEEFKYMLFGNERLIQDPLDWFMNNNDSDLRYVVSLNDKNESSRIGMVLFLLRDNGRYTYLGGIHPQFFNSGLGVYVSIAAISLFFEINPYSSYLSTGIFKYNTRSLKAHTAIGFYTTEETDSEYTLMLTKKQFENDFVMKVRNKIQYKMVKVANL